MATQQVPWNPVYGYVGGPPPGLTGQYATYSPGSNLPTLNTDPNQDIHNMFYNDQAITYGQGQQINQELQNNLQYYGPLQQQYQAQQDQALQQLNQTPGFTPQESSAIGADYSQFNTPGAAIDQTFMTPEEQAAAKGDPSAPVARLGTDLDNQGQMLNQYGANLGGQLAAYEGNLSGETGNFQTGTMTAAGQAQQALQDAQGGFSKLDEAVNNPALQFDPNNTEKQLTDADVQAMKTSAGARIGDQYKAAEDMLERQAAASGNASPMALAAARARLEHQEAADQGDSEANADIAARQAQYQRAAGIEQQREGAVGTQTGFRANAATQEQAQAQNAAALAGQEGLSAAEAAGQAGINAANQYGTAALNAANQYGQFSTNTLGQQAGVRYGANATAEQQAAQRAAALAQNRQQTQNNANQVRYAQGTGSQQLTSQGQQTIGGARMAGQQAYRTGVGQQQQLAQQGGQTALGQQLQEYGTQTSGLNSSTQARAGYETAGQGNSALNQATKVVNAVFEHGGVADKPTMAKLGERGPEMVVPLRKIRYGMPMPERMAA